MLLSQIKDKNGEKPSHLEQMFGGRDLAAPGMLQTGGTGWVCSAESRAANRAPTANRGKAKGLWLPLPSCLQGFVSSGSVWAFYFK